MQTLLALEQWLQDFDMDPELVGCIVEYMQRRGQQSRDEIVQEASGRLHAMGRSQVKIRWRRLLKRMILKEITGIQQQYYTLNGSKMRL